MITIKSPQLVLAALLILWGMISPPTLSGADSRFIEPVTPLPVARGFHGMAVLGDFLYVIGGSAKVDNKQVPATTPHVAKIFPQGQLSHFLTTSRLPQPRHYISNSTLVLNDTVYVIGGESGIISGESAQTVAWTRPSANGMLDSWKESAPFPQAGGLSCMVSLSTPGYLHVLGGLGKENQIHREVWSVKINPDGSLNKWESAPPLPSPLWFHAGAVAGGRVYIWGGLDYYSLKEIPYTCDSIYSAPILSSGRLGRWRTEKTKLPIGFYAAATATAGPYVFCLSPRYQGGKASNDLWWSYVTPKGMTTWKKRSTELPNKLYRAVTTDYRRGMIYISGGKSAKGTMPIANQFLIRLTPQAKALAEKAWLATQNSTQFASIDYTSNDQRELSFTTPKANATSAIPGFYPLEAGRTIAQSKKLPLIMYFNNEKATSCQEQLKAIQTEKFNLLFNDAVFCSIDPQKFPQIAQQYAVFRVPTWVCFNSNEEERGRLVGAQDLETLTSATQTLQ